MPFSILKSLNRLFGYHCSDSKCRRTCKIGYFKLKTSKKIPKETICFQSIVDEYYNTTIRNDPRYFKQRVDILVDEPFTLRLDVSENNHVHEYLCYDWGTPRNGNLRFQKAVVECQDDLTKSWEDAEKASPRKGKRMVVKRDFVTTPVDTEICRLRYPKSPTRYWKVKHTLSREYVNL